GGTYVQEWVGRVLTDLYDESTMGDPSDMEMKAIDGLGALENIPYLDSSGDAYSGRAFLKDIALNCLNKLGYAIGIGTACQWYPSQAGGSPSGDPWAQIEIDQGVFYDEKGEALSCYEVL